MADRESMRASILLTLATICVLNGVLCAYNPCASRYTSVVRLCEDDVVFGTAWYINGSSAKGHAGPCRCKVVFNPTTSYYSTRTVYIRPYRVPHLIGQKCNAELSLGGVLNTTIKCGFDHYKQIRKTVRYVQDFDITLTKQTRDSDSSYCIYISGFYYGLNPALICASDVANSTTPSPPRPCTTRRTVLPCNCANVTSRGPGNHVGNTPWPKPVTSGQVASDSSQCSCPAKPDSVPAVVYFGIGIAVPMTAIAFFLIGAAVAYFVLKRRKRGGIYEARAVNLAASQSTGDRGIENPTYDVHTAACSVSSAYPNDTLAHDRTNKEPGKF